MVLDLDASMANHKAIARQLAALLARAFHDYPEYLYLFPDEKKRHDKLVALFRVMAMYCLRYGKVIATLERAEAVLMYLPPPATISGAGMVKSGALAMLFNLGWTFLPKQGRIINVIATARETIIPSPHAYLFLLATDPASQKQGHASALMREFLGRIDASGTACYLETSDAENVAYYQRFGFELVEEKAVPGANVTIRALLRKGT
jgi:ribosomal protein S18 acetylase RimI-like enzyme